MTSSPLPRMPTHPMQLKALLWPRVRFYREQVQIIRSVWENDETWVCAGNKLGKDFVAGFVVLAYFLTRRPCRIITTSAKDDHLDVLWGEIGNFLQTSAIPLDVRRGGPLVIRQREIRRVGRDGQECKISYVKGMVASPDSMAAMQGHHVAKTGDGIPRTLFLPDECSGVPHDYYKMATGWANRIFGIGNPWPCENFFKHAVEGDPATGDPGGDAPRDTERNQKWIERYGSPSSHTRPSGAEDRGARSATPEGDSLPDGYRRKVFQLGVEDSPNVRYARWELEWNRKPSNRIVVPGVKDWEEYQVDLKRWDKVEQCIKLHGRFYRGAENLLFPPEWLNWSNELAVRLENRVTASGWKRIARAIGVDPAEGGDKSAWSVVDEFGLLWQETRLTPNTNDVYEYTLALMNRFKVDPSAVVFDRGGGGKEHADRLRAKGYSARSVGFGEAVTPDPKYGRTGVEEKVDVREERYGYVNRRAELYGKLSLRMDPTGDTGGFALPRDYAEVRRQLAPIAKVYDEGRLKLPPKRKKVGSTRTEKSLEEILGCSPDEADSLVLAVWAMENPAQVIEVG